MMADMQLEDFAREYGRKWGTAAARRRTGPPGRWPGFDGTQESARQRLRDLVDASGGLLDELARECIVAAVEGFEDVRAAARQQAAPRMLNEREERRRRRQLRG